MLFNIGLSPQLGTSRAEWETPPRFSALPAVRNLKKERRSFTGPRLRQLAARGFGSLSSRTLVGMHLGNHGSTVARDCC